MSGCAPAPTPEPTSTPVPPTITPSPVPPTFTPEPTATATSTPVPVCNPGNAVEGTIDDDITFGFMDITNVSTSLDGTTLTLVMTLREIPNEITINSKELSDFKPEIALGVAIDVDNNPDTGNPILLTNTGYGYDIFLHVYKFKTPGDEVTGAVENVFKYWYGVTTITESSMNYKTNEATLPVNLEAKTITLVGDVPNISPTSYLHFFTFYKDTDSVVDQLCQR